MNILFMCVANSARSQLAEGLGKSILEGCVVKSAGSEPGRLNPYAVSVMKEKGIDISRHYSKSVNELDPAFLAKLDFVITLCAEEVCPILPSKAQKLHWPFPDPATKEVLSESEMVSRFREARDGIEVRIQQFKKEFLK